MTSALRQSYVFGGRQRISLAAFFFHESFITLINCSGKRQFFTLPCNLTNKYAITSAPTEESEDIRNVGHHEIIFNNSLSVT